MTAQVAVMNTLGIALATDSAVTVSNNTDDTRKIYSSSDKLFRLSNIAPVSIMISGNPDFLEMPWETIIKVYRSKLGKKTFPNLSDYADDFFRFFRSFVRANAETFSLSAQNDWVWTFASELFAGVLADSSDRYEESETSAEHAEKNMPTIIHEVVAEKLKVEKKRQKIKGFGAAIDSVLRTKYRRLIAQQRKQVFEQYLLPAKTQRSLDNLIIESLTRPSLYWMSTETEIVFAGFGEGEYMPVCLSYSVNGMVQNALRHSIVTNVQISPKLPQDIRSFGQDETVQAFLRGVSQEFRDYMESEFFNFAVEMGKAFEHAIGRETTDHEDKKLIPVLIKQWNVFLKKFDEGEEKSFIPIFRMVATQPKDELAATAEMLVNLTKFRLRVSPEHETVGGPVDVALITKGDGFVWVKKKQYYPPELNTHKTDGSIGN